jgi:hypothetical protein
MYNPKESQAAGLSSTVRLLMQSIDDLSPEVLGKNPHDPEERPDIEKYARLCGAFARQVLVSVELNRDPRPDELTPLEFGKKLDAEGMRLCLVFDSVSKSQPRAFVAPGNDDGQLLELIADAQSDMARAAVKYSPFVC